MVFSNLGPRIARAKALMESKYFTVFIQSVGNIDMRNFKTIGECPMWPPRKSNQTSKTESRMQKLHYVHHASRRHFHLIFIPV